MDWDNKYATGVLIVDNDHKKLFELTNMLEELSAAEQPQTHLIENQITRLLDYTVYHFEREKELMVKYGVVHLNQHVAEHAEFVDVAKEACQNWMQNGEAAEIESLVKYLWNWLAEHIMGSDMELADALLLVDGINDTVA